MHCKNKKEFATADQTTAKNCDLMDGSAYDFKFFQHFMYTYIGLILIGINLVCNDRKSYSWPTVLF